MPRLLCFALCLGSMAYMVPPAHAQYPGDSWEAATPESLGVDKVKLAQARDYALTGEGSGRIIYRGKVIMEWGDSKAMYDLKSSSKGIGVTLLGIAMKDGKADLDDLAKKHHPDFGVPPQENQQQGWTDIVTLRMLANQTAGFAKKGGYEPLLFEPGTKWHYSDSGPNWLAECLTLAYGRDLDAVMWERVFTPIGIQKGGIRWRTHAYRPKEINGIPRREFGSGFAANVQAMSRIGYLYLRDGKWNGQEILPKAFLDAMRHPDPKLAGLPQHDPGLHEHAPQHYSMLWWNNFDGSIPILPRDATWTWGFMDSLIVVIPSLDLVVARAGKAWARKDGDSHYEPLKPFLSGIASALPARSMHTAAEQPAWKKGAVASVHPLATEAGMNALKQGGNAVDAAVATAITLGVVDGHNSGLGGGCFVLIRAMDGLVTAIDARETAPALATRDMYLSDGKVDEEASKTGALAPATPGALAGYALAMENHGKLKLADVLLPAAKLAEEGFPIDEVYARKLESVKEELAKFPASKALFFKEDGSLLQKGDLLKQPDLARTLRSIAARGPEWFYRGELAEKVDAWMRQNGGLLRKEDFAGYQPKLRVPLRTRYRGYEILGFPPPSSGGVHVAQILNMLETYDLAGMTTVERAHVIAESMKLAFADRAHWLGDPDFARVPRGLIDRGYAAALAAKIDLQKAAPVPSHGEPPKAQEDIFGDTLKHTTHLSVADAEGNWVALTQTINTAFGSKVIVPGTGVVLNNEMDDFAVAPGVPNAFKLVGAEANAVAPGKRPLSSMSPTIVLAGDDGEPILSIGAAGGPTIISQTLQNLVNILDLKMSVSEAIAAPRLHHQWSPDELRIEKGFGEAMIQALRERGHTIHGQGAVGIGVSQGVMWDEAAKSFRAAHDPRVPGKGDGW